MSRRARALLYALALPGALAAQPAPTARIVVDARRVEGAISPLLYGQFAEFMFEGVKGGMSAELLLDRGFDEAPNAIGLPRRWERYPDDRNDDYGLAFAWDDSVFLAATAMPGPLPPQHALRVELGPGVVERHGVFQPRVPVRAGIAYRASLWLRTSDYDGTVLVSLEEDASGGAVYAEARLDGVGSAAGAPGEWRRHEVVLRPSRSDPLARFAILFPRTSARARVWVDMPSLVPGDARGGIRADVEARVAALRPAFIRWPGGNVAQDYHWQWGVGARDLRPAWVNLSWKNELEPGDVGTDELIAFARRVGAEPTLTVNVEGRGATPEEAAAWVEYVNGPATSRWGAVRAANGHPEPYGVRHWEVGNEIWGSWVRGHSDAATYARNFRRYVDAMRAVDPTIRFIAVGDNSMEWNRTVLREVGRDVDFLAIHHYYGHDSAQRDVRNLMARPLHYERFYRDVERLARELVPGRPIALAINEWGLDVPEARQHGMDAALYGARLMNVLERSSPQVAMSAVSDMVNGWPGGIIQASRHGTFVTPLYHANALWAGHLGRERVRATVTGPTFDSGSEGRDVPVLDVVASRAGDTVYVKIVNVDPSRAVETRVELRGARVEPGAEWEILAADRPDATNSFATPDAIVPRREAVSAGASFTLRIPAASASVLTLRVRR